MAVNFGAQIEVRDARNGSWFWIHTHVWRDSRLKSTDKAVYATLASYAGSTQEAFPSTNKIANDIGGYSPRTVYRSLKTLERTGYISIYRTLGKPNIYTLLKTKSPVTPMSPVTPETVGSDTRDSGTSDTRDTLTISSITITNNKREGSLKYLKQLSETDIQELQTITGASRFQIREKAASLIDYCEAHGKKYRDYRALLRNALRKDFPKQATMSPRQVGNDLPEISEEARQRNLARLAEMKKSLNF